MHIFSGLLVYYLSVFVFHKFKDNLITGLGVYLTLWSLETSILLLSEPSYISLGIFSDKLSVITESFFTEENRFGVVDEVLLLGELECSTDSGGYGLSTMYIFGYYCVVISFGSGDISTI